METVILLMHCFINQYTCTFLQNEGFIRIAFVEFVSRLLSGWEEGGGYSGSTHTQTRATQQLQRVSKKVFYRICNVIST